MAGFGDERIQKVLRGRREVVVVPFPGVEGEEVGVRILTEEDIDAARADAAQHVELEAKRLKLDSLRLLSVDPEFMDREFQRQIIARAFFDAEDSPADRSKSKPFFATARAVRQCDAPLVETLYQLYVVHQNSVSPLVELDAEDVKELADALSKGQTSMAILGAYDAPTLRSLVLSIVHRLSS